MPDAAAAGVGRRAEVKTTANVFKGRPAALRADKFTHFLSAWLVDSGSGGYNVFPRINYRKLGAGGAPEAKTGGL
jgi:hypothetical protein